MSLKQKIWASYIVMIIVPFFLAVLSARLILINYEQGHQLQIIEAVQDEKIREYTDFAEELESTLVNHPDYFKDKLYLERINNKITSFGMGMLIQDNDQFTYNSLPVKAEKLKPYLSKFLEQDISKRWVTAIAKEYIVRCRAISFSDGTTGRIYLFMSKIAPWDPPPGQFNEYVKWVFIIFIICILVTNSFLTYHMSKSLIDPLNSVKKAAMEIQRGNLDYPISYPAKNEIGELYRTFEEMRLKLKQSQALNTQYENSRKQLIFNISHDLKTPLTTIKGYAQGIIDGVANNPAKMEKYLRTILNYAVEMERLTNDLVLFSELDIKQLPFDFETIEINKYLEDAIEELNFSLSENSIDLSFVSHYESQDLIMADRQRLVRVIHNIIENAQKHLNKEHKEIQVILKEDNSGALIEIKDNGCGIPEDKLSFIFDRFFRVDSARNRTTGGSGIGLSIAKEIIEAHQGRIWVKSTEGLGTSIFFTLKKSKYFIVNLN
ncbi:HAMP domain-containing protein [Desulfotomaculum arcticum]|uniref:histidine kinase n=1 Tax=Desulfotruncus arcticus DSM 17038 TaxID=1121424 RepID=A0A1I2XTE4_9FIRM|nr:HAMP domain-containing sensor histidine kinase [Desulfotruncus arcticus]SFH15361.1 HAMP domain-containing protein [Desulfotomaculum arcticum] [Desulfotruncus arcticus DSM 17038]